MVYKVVLIRHGESEWNKKNLFTGWTDVDLTNKGIKEAISGGESLRKKGFTFDIAYTSYMKKAIRTLWIVMDAMDLMWIPVERSWRLNERHYGALQGFNKSKTARKYGEEQVLMWRRSYDVLPPAIKKSDFRYPGKDIRYKDLKKSELPVAECLKDVEKRVLVYWKKEIVPSIKKGKKVLIVAHGNSLRALIRYLEDLKGEDVVSLDLPAGVPMIYEFDKKFKIKKKYYLGDKRKIQKAIAKVKKQGKK